MVYGPVTTVYERPVERVLFHPERDANPFFHLYEALWMLAGFRAVEPLAQFVGRMRTYSDDGIVLHGAYGHRWRHHFKLDQLEEIVRLLTVDPNSRRAVLGMWDPEVDLARNGKDLPCNTHAYFSRDLEGRLDLTVGCRSNDIIWGAYGANAVHFSMLQEYVAAHLGWPVGRYWQVSNNYHAYWNVYDALETEWRPAAWAAYTPEEQNLVPPNPYNRLDTQPIPLVSIPVDAWRSELQMLLTQGGALGFRDRFLRGVAMPMLQAHSAYRAGSGEARYHAALEALKGCAQCDWRCAGEGWLLRRLERYRRREDAL